MSVVPENTVTMADMVLWYKTAEEVKKLQNLERILRLKIFKHYFPEPEEGVNNFTMPDGSIVKGTRIISRDVDIGTVNAYKMPGPNGEPSKFEQMNINIDHYLRWKPELKVGEYRKLTAEELAFIDQCLIVKDGMPQLAIVAPKPT